MSGFSRGLIERSGYARDGFAAHYDRYRPHPPEELLDTLLQVAAVETAALVVDLGTGTGLSARAWSKRSEQVIGIEPNPAMLERARAATAAANVEYRLAFAHETGLPAGCADLVTCSQSFHWMEAPPTLAEAARVLRPGGVFAAYDYDVVPVCDWRAEAAFRSLLDRRRAYRIERGEYSGSDRWPKDRHLAQIEVSGLFRYAREVVLQSVEPGSADRLVGLAYSLGLPVPAHGGEVEQALRYGEFEAEVRAALGERALRFRFGYRVRLGVR